MNRRDGTSLLEPPVEDPHKRVTTKYPGIYRRGDRFVIWTKCSGCKGGRCPDGHYETLDKSVVNLRDAHNIRATKVSDLAKGKLVVATKTRFNDYADQWLETHKGNLKPSTWRLYHAQLRAWARPALGNKLLTEITVSDIVHLVGSMKAKERKAWTIRNTLNPMSSIFNDAVLDGLMPMNPVKALPKRVRPKSDQRQMRTLSSDEIEELLTGGKWYEYNTRQGLHGGFCRYEPHVAPHWKPLVAFLIFTGMRISEALNVQWEDIDWGAGTVRVTVSKTEAGEGREVTLMPSLQKMLRERWMLEGRRSGFVFVMPEGSYSRRDSSSRAGQRVSRSYVGTHVVKPAMVRAGITVLATHELRHTFASMQISMGMDMTYICNQMGHANPSITLKLYSHLMDQDKRREAARNQMEAAFGGVL